MGLRVRKRRPPQLTGPLLISGLRGRDLEGLSRPFAVAPSSPPPTFLFPRARLTSSFKTLRRPPSTYIFSVSPIYVYIHVHKSPFLLFLFVFLSRHLFFFFYSSNVKSSLEFILKFPLTLSSLSPYFPHNSCAQYHLLGTFHFSTARHVLIYIM